MRVGLDYMRFAIMLYLSIYLFIYLYIYENDQEQVARGVSCLQPSIIIQFAMTRFDLFQFILIYSMKFL